MSLVTEFIGEVVWHLLLEQLLHSTGRRLLFAISFGRIRIPPLDAREGGVGSDLAAILAGALFWLLTLGGAALALYAALA